MQHFLDSLAKTFSYSDTEAMALAIQLARQGLYTTSPNPRVGCALTKNGKIISTGWHEQAGGPHAEVAALNAAGEQAKGATAFVTLEPCSHFGKTPPCADALIKAGVRKVVAAMVDPNPNVAGQGLKKLHDAGIEVAWGLLEEEAKSLNPGFIKRMLTQQPFVRVKVATSLDGRTALASGASKWITSASARADVQKWRAQSCAVILGIESVLADDPSMTVRQSDWQGEQPPLWQSQGIRQPLRVILDSRLRIPLAAKLLQQTGNKVLIACTRSAYQAQSDKRRDLEAVGHEVLSLNEKGRIDLNQLLSALAYREINEVLVETGPTLAGAFIAADLTDEMVIYLAPKLMGHEGKAAFELPGIRTMDDAIPLTYKDIRHVGQDLRIIASPKRPTSE